MKYQGFLLSFMHQKIVVVKYCCIPNMKLREINKIMAQLGVGLAKWRCGATNHQLKTKNNGKTRVLQELSGQGYAGYLLSKGELNRKPKNSD